MATTRIHQAATPPYSVASEKIVLALLLREPQSIELLRSIDVQAATFFRPEHGKLFAAINSACVVEPKVTQSSLLNHLKDAPIAVGIVDELLGLNGVESRAALQHAAVVVEKARQRQLIDVLSNTLHDAYQNIDGCDAVIKRAKKRLTDLQKKMKSPQANIPPT